MTKLMWATEYVMYINEALQAEKLKAAAQVIKYYCTEHSNLNISPEEKECPGFWCCLR